MKTSLVLAASLVLGAAGAIPAAACPPSATTSSEPHVIVLVGESGSIADAIGSATFVVRDLANNTVAGSVVAIDFSNCSDVRLSGDAQPAGVSWDCAHHTLRGVTDVTGQVTFRIVGAGNGGSPRASLACAQAYVDGVPLQPIAVSALDLDGANGVCAADLAAWGRDFAMGGNPARSDYDGDGVVSVSDLAFWGRALARGGSGTSGNFSCP